MKYQEGDVVVVSHPIRGPQEVRLTKKLLHKGSHRHGWRGIEQESGDEVEFPSTCIIGGSDL